VQVLNIFMVTVRFKVIVFPPTSSLFSFSTVSTNVTSYSVTITWNPVLFTINT